MSGDRPVDVGDYVDVEDRDDHDLERREGQLDELQELDPQERANTRRSGGRRSRPSASLGRSPGQGGPNPF